MNPIPQASSSYTTLIDVWVEDTLTRDYLKYAWGNPANIEFFIAGGKANIRAMVESARKEKSSYVFGICDRDFDNSNHAKWQNPAASRVLVLLRHEIENYMIDEVTLQGCMLNSMTRTLPDIQSRLRELASEQTAWLAYKRVMRLIRTEFLGASVKEERIHSVKTLDDAKNHLLDSPILKELPAYAEKWQDSNTVNQMLEEIHQQRLDDMNTGNWRVEFSGKEMFKPIIDYIYQKTKKQKESGGYEINNAIEIGEWQKNHNSVPADITAIFHALRHRAGIPDA